jgi:Caspase domain
MKGLIPAAALLTLLAASAPAGADTTRRFALVIGANRGAADRVPLRYAVTDAERFADIVSRMGGVLPADRAVLRDPTRAGLLEALDATGRRTAEAKAADERVEVIVYFSGHADDQGLMLGRELLSYRDLRDAVGALHADVGITILDACASGAITRLKGGTQHPAFLSGAENATRGYAFLTSSSENEAAQESERLRGSFFTHALLSGLRGAADVTGDGRVTLNEAYQFAFSETLVQTTTTQAGAQHPAYDIKMAGTGDVVMTDVRNTSSRLVFGDDYDGRFVVLGPNRQLVAELYKPRGRRVELGLEPGSYGVYFEQEKQLLTTSVTLVDGQQQELVRASLKPTRRWPTQYRGHLGENPPDLLDRRVRVQGGWGPRFTFSHWVRRDIAFALTFGDRTFNAQDRTIQGSVLYYPPFHGRVRPHLGVGIGRFDVPRYTVVENPEGVFRQVPDGHEATVGFTPSVGIDVYVGRNFSLSLDSRASIVDEATDISTWVSLGWTFGGR